ncbi:MAG: tripartite tricarboxylate transporter TctB family protein [Alphaproteobacteria bacterium]|nr:tripartite tricarboxylate transporter TctB family protein [Alphaproteobacteria bacterium]
MIQTVRGRELAAGALILAMGAAFAWFSGGLGLGTATRMGSGYVPRLLGILLAGLGLIVIVRAWLMPATPLEKTNPPWIPLLWIAGSIVGFAALVERIGLFLSVVLVVAVCRAGAPERRWIEILILAAALSGFCALLFIKGLGLTMPLWPGER